MRKRRMKLFIAMACTLALSACDYTRSSTEEKITSTPGTETDVQNTLKTDMSEYITYTLPDSLTDGDYDASLGSLGGNLFLSDKYEKKDVEEESIPDSWTSIGGVELYYQINTTFKAGNLTEISLPWNHSEFTENAVAIENCEVSAILVPVSHDLVTGADDISDKTENEISSNYWYAFFAKEDSDITYALFLSQDYFTEEDMITMAQSVNFTDEAFDINVE